jgi:hypothetical protein
MRRVRAWLIRLSGLFRKGRHDAELSAELESHLQLHIDDNLRAGMTLEAARREAMLKLGGIEQTREIYRDRRGLPLLETIGQDLRFTFRQLLRSPGFSLVAALVLALGIGANTAVFSVVESVLLRPLPFQHPDQLVAVWAMQKGQPARIGASMPEFEDYKVQSRSFEYLANVLSGWTYTWTGQGEPRTVNCTGVSYDFFPIMGIQPYLGRLYEPEEYHVDGVQVVISYRFWREQLGGDPHAIGRVLNLDGTATRSGSLS